MQRQILNYRVIIEPESSEDGMIVYNAYCPTLGIADYGDSVEEVLASIKDGIELAVDSLKSESKEVPVDHIEKQIITSVNLVYEHDKAASIHKTA